MSRSTFLAAFSLCAVRGDLLEFRVRIRIRFSRQRRLKQPLRNNVGETAIRRGRVRVVLNCEAEVTGRRLTGAFQHILATTDELDDGQ